MRARITSHEGRATAACLLGLALAEVLAVLPGQLDWALDDGFDRDDAPTRFRLLTVSHALLYHSGGGWDAARYEAVRMLVFTALLVGAVRWAAPRLLPVEIRGVVWLLLLPLLAAPANLVALAAANLRPLLLGTAPRRETLELVVADAQAFAGHAVWLALLGGAAVVVRDVTASPASLPAPAPGDGPGGDRPPAPGLRIPDRLVLSLAVVVLSTAVLVLLRDHVVTGSQTLCGPRAPCGREGLEDAFLLAWSERWEPYEGVPYVQREWQAAQFASLLPALAAGVSLLCCWPLAYFWLGLLAKAPSRPLAAFAWGWGVCTYQCVLYAVGIEAVLLWQRQGEVSAALLVQVLSPPAGLTHAAVLGWAVGLAAAAAALAPRLTGRPDGIPRDGAQPDRPSPPRT